MDSVRLERLEKKYGRKNPAGPENGKGPGTAGPGPGGPGPKGRGAGMPMAKPQNAGKTIGRLYFYFLHYFLYGRESGRFLSASADHQ